MKQIIKKTLACCSLFIFTGAQGASLEELHHAQQKISSIKDSPSSYQKELLALSGSTDDIENKLTTILREATTTLITPLQEVATLINFDQEKLTAYTEELTQLYKSKARTA